MRWMQLTETTENFRIDLDHIDAISYYEKDADNSAFEHYGIDLDTFNAS